jgi:CRP/FNR family transcriptional regulator, cyclic AMP receptor protein
MLKFFKQSFSEEDTILFKFLKKNPLLESLTNEELAKFQPYIYTRAYVEDEVVFFTGDPSHALYIVKRGVVSLNLEIKGEFEKLMILRNGYVFGDNSILDGAKRIYSAIVHASGTELYVIPKVNLKEIMEHDPIIKSKIMYSFANMYNGYTEKLFETYKGSRGFFDLNTIYS